jgi:hypothetical protein
LSGGNLVNLGDHFVAAFGDMYSTAFFTLPGLYKSNSDLFERFNKAAREATPLANKYDRDTITAIAEAIKVSPEDLELAGRPLYIADLPTTAVQQMKSWMCERLRRGPQDCATGHPSPPGALGLAASDSFCRDRPAIARAQAHTMT